MFKKSLTLLVLCGATLFTMTACGGENNTYPSAQTNSPASASAANSASPANAADSTEIRLETMSFAPAQVTIQKGESLVLVNDTFMPHTVSNGTWKGSKPIPAREAGAPELNELRINANNYRTVGPFDTAGTFQIYCPMHPKMNLTVVVE